MNIIISISFYYNPSKQNWSAQGAPSNSNFLFVHLWFTCDNKTEIVPDIIISPRLARWREKEMATHQYSCPENLWTEEPGGLLSIVSHRAGHDWSNLAWMRALEKEMATHSSILAWRIPGSLVGCLLSMGLCRVWHDWSDLVAAAATYGLF